ncbi:MAG: hypothetical protein V2A58_03100 [Planctomycetota bacterium]
MKRYLYLLMTPEALVASMLAPAEFGSYLAIGTKKRSRGSAVFFDVAEDFQSDYFDLSQAAQRCVPHADGQPKHSVYLSIYRVLEHVPLATIRSLWLTTVEGRVLELKPGGRFPGSSDGLHLYQEICPVHPLVVSSLDPESFSRFITDPGMPISVPRIAFVDLELGDLAKDPQRGSGADLPYRRIDHLRDCLLALRGTEEKHTKTVDRIHPQEFHYRCIKRGVFVGDQQGMLFYPFPSHEDLDREHHEWWKSATTVLSPMV